MWVFTIDGFYSAVQHNADPGTILVRARVAADLERMCDRLPAPGYKPVIQHTPNRDYAYRTTLPRAMWEQYLAYAVEAIDYTNFKSAVAMLQGHDRADVYLDVWATMLDLQKTGE